MNTFKNIPIQVEGHSPEAEMALARALLYEIHTLLKGLFHTGQGGCIDLRALPPMGPLAYRFLKDSLSVGEVSASIAGDRRSDIQETAFPGVWWITHRNEREEIVTELIEVTEFPDLLKSQREDIRLGLKKMQGSLPRAESEEYQTPSCRMLNGSD
ncbi:MAG: hydrogenase expression/formation C-terminal domain-containing protein [Methylococcaceae bacterium]|nr:hydrogenase expression/formation C-terminal domain-containing protein [Methylococcaceae bacterium]